MVGKILMQLNSVIYKSRESLHDNDKKVRGDRIPLSESPRAPEETSEFTIDIKRELRGAYTLFDPLDKWKRELQAVHNQEEEFPVYCVKSFEEVYPNGASGI